jgi:alkaline phosphatase D
MIYRQILLLLFVTNNLFTQSITPTMSVFQQGEQIVFDYSGGTGSATDWIGIYLPGQVPGNISSTVWKYITTKQGQISFDGTLPIGKYDIHLLCCDGYSIITSYRKFEIVGTKLQSRLRYYKEIDSIKITVNGGVIGSEVKLYNQSDIVNGIPLPGVVPVTVTLSSINSSGNAEVNFGLMSRGMYSVLLYENGNLISFSDFEVRLPKSLPSNITRIGTGSCSGQGNPQPTLIKAIEKDIDLFIYSGDNVYIDTYDMNIMRAKYEEFITKRTEFQLLRTFCPLLATWDDHDYGCCDEDKDYPFKIPSQKQFLDFWDEPTNSPRRTQEGINASYIVGEDGKKLQIILLDTRYFEDNKRPNNGCGQNDYCPWSSPGDTSKTMLGAKQWSWLKDRLLEKADLRLIVSSVQFGCSYNGWEGWAIFPFERKKMQKLIADTRAEGVFFVSGDIHYSEVSKLPGNNQNYPIYDFTASAINQSWPPEANTNRVAGKVYGDPSVGIIDIDWAGQMLTFSTIDPTGQTKFSHDIAFGELKFKPSSSEEVVSFPSHYLLVDSGSVRLQFKDVKVGKVDIVNSLGQVLKSENLAKTDGIELENLRSGFYFARYWQGDKVSSLEFFIP